MIDEPVFALGDGFLNIALVREVSVLLKLCSCILYERAPYVPARRPVVELPDHAPVQEPNWGAERASVHKIESWEQRTRTYPSSPARG